MHKFKIYCHWRLLQVFGVFVESVQENDRQICARGVRSDIPKSASGIFKSKFSPQTIVFDNTK